MINIENTFSESGQTSYEPTEPKMSENNIPLGHIYYGRETTPSSDTQFIFRKPYEIENMPHEEEFLIEGLLRPKKKMLMIASPKMGKTFLAVNLCLGIVSGTEFLGFRCHKGKVLYLDCETGNYDIVNRIYSVAEQRGISKETCQEIDICNPKEVYMGDDENLLNDLANYVDNGKYNLIVIDSVYCIFDGDENSNRDVNRFMKKVDYLIRTTGASVLMIHHEGKGGRFKKNIIDRACGSTVFARFPDTILGLSPSGKTSPFGGIREEIEMSLRAFPPIEKIKVIFKNGLHIREDSLKMSESANEIAKTPSPKKSKRDCRWEKYSEVFDDLDDSSGIVKISDIAKALGVSRGTVYSDLENGLTGFKATLKGALIRTDSAENHNETNEKESFK